MRTFVYVDGFNLYHRLLKDRPACRWLDLLALSRRLLPNDEVAVIRYFTAQTNVRPTDPPDDTSGPQRQQTYLRALGTLPCVTIQLGQFKTRRRWMPRADDPATMVQVLRTEEKGSDVNLATALLVDASLKRFERAAIVSMDTDLRAPIKAVREDFRLPVTVILPRRSGGQHLLPGDRYIHIRTGDLEGSQFPQTLSDNHGRIHQPARWQ